MRQWPRVQRSHSGQGSASSSSPTGAAQAKLLQQGLLLVGGLRQELAHMEGFQGVLHRAWLQGAEGLALVLTLNCVPSALQLLRVRLL
jgi:hypothetical protein